MIDPKNVFYVNLDDNQAGLYDKLRQSEEYDFHMLAEGQFGFTASALIEILEELTNSGNATNIVVIVDTLKKIADLMDKRKTSLVMAAARRFTLKGGTFIGLAHTNKNVGADGRAIFAGTTDARDDADCAYILEEIKGQARANEKIVEFRNIKRRGNNPLRSAYAYSVEQGISYRDLLLSVRKVEPEQVEEIAAAVEMEADEIIVAAIRECIREGIVTQMKLASEAGKRSKTSRRVAAKVLDKYTGEDPAQHHWKYAIGARGAHVYVLLEHHSG